MLKNKSFFKQKKINIASDQFCYLSLGSNLGNRKYNIEKAISLIAAEEQIDIIKISSIIEYPALYKNISKSENVLLNYFNLVVKITFSSNDPFALLAITQQIEEKIGKNNKGDIKPNKSFNARLIDIDILLFKEFKITDGNRLIVPHYDLQNRSFFLDLLVELDSDIKVNQLPILDARRRLNGKQSALMQIINVNDNSFSLDGITENGKINKKKFKKIIQDSIRQSIPIIDIGAISTAPCNKNIYLTIKEECKLITTALDLIYEEFSKSKYTYILPKISLDVFRVEVMEFLLKNQYYFDIINDQTGFEGDYKINLFKDMHHDIIIMHSVSLPVKKNEAMIGDMISVCLEIKNFLLQKKNFLMLAGISPSRIIIDPGIGFGKSAEQSIFILKNINLFFDINTRLLIGHSRKRFIDQMNYNVNSEKKQNIIVKPKTRDFDTAVLSIFLNNSGIEILRIHNYELNKKSILSYLLLSS